MTVDEAIICLSDMKIKVAIPKAAVQARLNNDALDMAIEALRCSEIPNNWIPCSERLPEAPYGCLVTVWDTDPITMDEFENILPYFVGWDGEQWNDGEGEQCPFEVIAWMPLPEPARLEND